MSIEIVQCEIVLSRRARGFHLVTDEIASQITEIGQMTEGVLHLHLQHTSASLTINENASADVPRDLEHYMDRLVPDGYKGFEHTMEGPDDMPAHVKASLIGCDVTVPLKGGAMALGTWQGVFLCEFRNRPGPRRIVATAIGRVQ